MGKFTEIVEEFKNFNKEIDFGDDLAQFFCLIVMFNNKKPMDLLLKRRIEAHFDYKWKNDKNQCLNLPEDRNIFNQLPEDTQIYVFRNFLYADYLNCFKRFFSIPNKYSVN